jgi:hypothetical protein
VRPAITLLLLLGLACAACTQPPPPNPTPVPVPVTDAGPTSAVVTMCAHVSALGCVEPDCARIAQHVVDTRHTLVPFDCLNGAEDKAAVRSCGFFLCQ